MGPDFLSAAKTATQLGLGIVQDIQANRLKKEANAAAPPLVDPTQASFLSELNQKRASLDAGSAYAAGLNNIRATNAGTNVGLVQAGAGNTGGTIQALLQSQRVSEDAANQLNAQGQNQQNITNSAYNQLLNDIADRKASLQYNKEQQLLGEWATKQQTANQNIGAAFPGIGNFISKNNNPAPNNPPATTLDPNGNTAQNSEGKFQADAASMSGEAGEAAEGVGEAVAAVI